MVSAGILTAPETCVISNLRLNYTLVAEGARASMLIVFADMADKLGIETVGEVVEMIQNTEARRDLMIEREIDLEQNEIWTQALAKVNEEFDIPSAKEIMEEHLITFMMAMRCDPTWDYPNTSELSREEREAILDFVLDEEGVSVVPEEHQDHVPVKKP